MARAARAGSAAPEITRPGLGDRVDPALVVRGGAERRAVVEVGAPIPVAVPRRARSSAALRALARVRASARRARARRAPRPVGRSSQSVVCRNQPSQTLSPRPSWPTRFMPSFQSPVPISGRPCAPTARLRSSARAQCSKSVARSADDRGLEVGVVLARRRARGPSRNGTTSSSTAASPVTSR